MRELLLFVLLLTLATGTRAANLTPRVTYELLRAENSDPEQLVENSTPTATTAATTVAASNASGNDALLESPNKEQTIESELISSTEAPLLMPPMASMEQPGRRRIVTYDQRQEGQYNIRADLENFMIVFVPSGQQSSMDLLDLLSKSNLRRSNSNTAKTKRQRISQLGRGTQSKPFLGTHPRNSPNYTPQVAIIEPNKAQQIPEFIEGRTPYHVDISSNEDEHARLQSERQVDVLPPPYLPQLIKPYHLEAEPQMISALPPAEIGSPVNYLDGYGKLLATELRNNAQHTEGVMMAGASGNLAGSPAGYYRLSRTIRGDSFLDSNRLGGSKYESSARSASVPILRAELASSGGKMYPPIDAPTLHDYLGSDFARNAWRLSEVDDGQSNRRLDGDVLDLELLNADADIQFVAPKSLLSDGLERCAPGHRRNSYGVCREISGY